MKVEKPIEYGSEAWLGLLREIVDKFKVSETIPHEWLKAKFNIKYPARSEYECDEDYIGALQLHQFAYMTLTDKLRMDMLKSYQYWIINIRGDGYAILPPKDQTEWAYDNAKDEVKKALSRSVLIMSNVRSGDIPAEQRTKDNDTAARLSMLRQMVSGFFRNKD